jgi:hypothetical protein
VVEIRLQGTRRTQSSREESRLMAYEQKPGDFALFKNDKEGNEKRPDYTGSGLDLSGQRIKISAWIKQGAKGNFMSCRIQPMTRGEPAPRSAPRKNVDEDIPF